MSVLGFLLLLIIAAISGALGQALVGRSLGGWAVTTLVGFVGALLGMWLSGALGLPLLLPVNVGGQTFPVVWAVIGSALLALLPGVINYVRANMKR